VVDLSRRAMIGAVGLGIVGTAISWPRLTGADIPGRGQDALTITVFGTPTDITLSELALETFFPADEHTAATLRQLADTLR